MHPSIINSTTKIPMFVHSNWSLFMYILYCDKAWVFDQSERVQGPIYIIKQNKMRYILYFGTLEMKKYIQFSFRVWCWEFGDTSRQYPPVHTYPFFTLLSPQLRNKFSLLVLSYLDNLFLRLLSKSSLMFLHDYVWDWWEKFKAQIIEPDSNKILVIDPIRPTISQFDYSSKTVQLYSKECLHNLTLKGEQPRSQDLPSPRCRSLQGAVTWETLGTRLKG